MLTVHHLGRSQSERIVWLCEELGIEYELKRYDRDPVTRLAPPQFMSIPINDGRGSDPKSFASKVLMQAITEFGPESIKDFDVAHERALVRVNESDMDIVKRKVNQ